jgi:hypothetical protein
VEYFRFLQGEKDFAVQQRISVIVAGKGQADKLII